MLKILALALVALLSPHALADAHEYIYIDHVVHGPFKNKLHKNSEIYFSSSQDENNPVYMIMSVKKPDGRKKEFIIDKYDIAGSPPLIESLFFHDIRNKKNAIVIVSWGINSRGIGTYGKLYQIFSYEKNDDDLISNDLIRLDPRMSGLDGYQDGEPSEFKLKTAKDAKQFFDKHLN
jgi:hypothetical protein